MNDANDEIVRGSLKIVFWRTLRHYGRGVGELLSTPSLRSAHVLTGVRVQHASTDSLLAQPFVGIS